MKQIEHNKKHWRIATDDLYIQHQQNHLQQWLPKDLGEGCSSFFKLDQELNYIDTRYTPAKDFSLLSQMDNGESKLVITLGIKGRSSFVAKQGNDVLFNEGYTTITRFNSSVGERKYQADKELHQLRFSLSKAWLSKYMGDQQSTRLFKNDSFNNLSYQPITPHGLMAIQQLLVCKASDKTNHMFMHGQALSLLSSELKHLFNDERELSKYTQHDKEIARTARDILFTEFKNPPSVEQLSKRVGTNQLKLKKLFHHFFNTTPYGLLLEIRMNIAYQLLESSHCHVGIAAEFVGYSHASNFSTAFTKFFGIAPKSVARKR